MHNGFALSSSALAAGALHETGFPVELLYAPPNHPDLMEQFRSIAKAAKAYSGLKQCRIGVIGGLFPNLVSCRYDTQKVNSQLGITIVPITFDEIRESMQKLDGDSLPPNSQIPFPYTINTGDKKALNAGLMLHNSLKRIAGEKKLDGFAAECWTGFPRELGLNPCLGFMEDCYTLACEGDLMLCVTLLIIRYLTGVFAYAGDIYDLSMDGILKLVHCGGPASLARNKKEVVFEKSQAASAKGFETMTCKPQLDPGPVTLIRLYGFESLKMHVAFGNLTHSESSPDLGVHIELSGDRWKFLEQCFGNHYAVAPGDIRNELRLLCKWLGITLFET